MGACKGKVDVSIGDDIEDTQGLAAQGIGILGTGWSFPAAEGCCDIIQFIGNGKETASFV